MVVQKDVYIIILLHLKIDAS